MRSTATAAFVFGILSIACTIRQTGEDGSTETADDSAATTTETGSTPEDMPVTIECEDAPSSSCGDAPDCDWVFATMQVSNSPGECHFTGLVTAVGCAPTSCEPVADSVICYDDDPTLVARLYDDCMPYGWSLCVGEC